MILLTSLISATVIEKKEKKRKNAYANDLLRYILDWTTENIYEIRQRSDELLKEWRK